MSPKVTTVLLWEYVTTLYSFIYVSIAILDYVLCSNFVNINITYLFETWPQRRTFIIRYSFLIKISQNVATSSQIIGNEKYTAEGV